MGIIFTLIVGGIIGWLAGVILGKDIPGGVIGNIIAGMLGSWLGGQFFSFGPVMADIAIFPALIGSILLIMIVSFILKQTR